MKIDKCQINFMNRGNKITDVLYYYKPRIPIYYPYPTSSNKSPYRVFFNSAWVFVYDGTHGGLPNGVYYSLGLFEYKTAIQFLICLGAGDYYIGPLDNNYDKTYTHTYNTDLYSTVTNNHASMSRHYDQVIKNDHWLHIESLLDKKTVPTELENNLLVMKQQKEKLEQQIKIS